MALMRFLAGLPFEYETAKSQNLSNVEITSMQKTFSRVLCTKTISSSPQTNAFIVRGGGTMLERTTQEC